MKCKEKTVKLLGRDVTFGWLSASYIWHPGPYLRIEPGTVISPIGFRGRHRGLRSLVIPWRYDSNVKYRFEWGFIEVFRIKGL